MGKVDRQPLNVVVRKRIHGRVEKFVVSAGVEKVVRNHDFCCPIGASLSFPDFPQLSSRTRIVIELMLTRAENNTELTVLYGTIALANYSRLIILYRSRNDFGLDPRGAPLIIRGSSLPFWIQLSLEQGTATHTHRN